MRTLFSAVWLALVVLGVGWAVLRGPGAVPMPAVPAGKVLAGATVPWPEVQAGLNAGATAKLCRAQKDLGEVSVAAIRCDQASPMPHCSASVLVPASAAALLAELASPAGLSVASKC